MSTQTICRCGKYLKNNVIPCAFLRLLFSDEQVALLMPPARDKTLSRTKKPRSKIRKKAIAQRLIPLHSASVEAFECPDCGRLHIFWQKDRPATSYHLRLEKPHGKASDGLGSAHYRFVADVNYDQVMDAFRVISSDTVEQDWPIFQEHLLKASNQAWFREEAQQVVIEWEQGWLSEYLYEYGEMPLLL